jgi:hypothetical protein
MKQTGKQVGAHLWGIGLVYNDLEWSRGAYNLDEYTLAELQAGWLDMENSYDKYCKQDSIR